MQIITGNYVKFFSKKNSIVQNSGVIKITSNEDYLLLLVRYMARDGIDKKDIIKRLSISSRKYNSIIEQLGENPDELVYQKMLTDYQVEDALLKKALGSTSTEVKETEKKTGTETVTVTKEVPADTSALQFWLKNRCPNKWSEKGAEMSNIDENLMKIFNAISDKADEEFNDNDKN